MIVSHPLVQLPEIVPCVYSYFILGARRKGVATLCFYQYHPSGVFGGISGGRGFNTDRVLLAQEFNRLMGLAERDVLFREADLLGFSRSFEFMGEEEEFRILNAFVIASRDYHEARYSAYTEFASQLLDNAMNLYDHDERLYHEWMRQYTRIDDIAQAERQLLFQFSQLLGASKLYGPGGLVDKYMHMANDYDLVIGGK